MAGATVFIPVRASGRTDLVFEDGAGLHRVQVKAGSLAGDVVRFMTCSQTDNVPRDYRCDVDYFGVYCHELGTAFLVPVADVPRTAGYLRLRAPRITSAGGFGGRSSTGSTGRRRRCRRAPRCSTRPTGDRGQYHTEVARRVTGPRVPA